MSVREKSTEDLIQAIHLPGNDGFTMDRARTCLRLFRAFDMDPGDVQAKTLEGYVKALRTLPQWAVAQGFDAFERDGDGMPTPPKIVRLARQAVDRLRQEVQHRQQEARRQIEASRPHLPERSVDEKARAEHLLRDAGFTPKRLEQVRANRLASTQEDLEREPEKPLHWTETADPDGPEMQELRAARAENSLIQMGQQKRKENAA